MFNWNNDRSSSFRYSSDAGYNAYNGNYLKISHGNGLETMYLHCSKLLVSSGQECQRTDDRKIRATGMVSGAHLHFVVKRMEIM